MWMAQKESHMHLIRDGRHYIYRELLRPLYHASVDYTWRTRHAY